MLSDNCWQCDKKLDLQRMRVNYVERELVPTADGGDFIRTLLSFCSPACLRKWAVRVLSHE